MSNGQLNVCVVGAGPRGLSVLERICANERKSPAHGELRIHVVDPHPPGAGRVWRTDQPDLLLMNTVASQVTVYTDDSVEMEGPIEAGPSLYEWARSVVRGDGVGPGLPGGALAEARQLGPDDYPTRAFYGHYLGDTFRRVVAERPGARDRARPPVHGDRAGRGGGRGLPVPRPRGRHPLTPPRRRRPRPGAPALRAPPNARRNWRGRRPRAGSCSSRP